MLGILQTLVERRDQLMYLSFSVAEAVLGSRWSASRSSAGAVRAARVAAAPTVAGAAEKGEVANAQAAHTEALDEAVERDARRNLTFEVATGLGPAELERARAAHAALVGSHATPSSGGGSAARAPL